MTLIGVYGKMMELYPVTSVEASTPELATYSQTLGGRVVEFRGSYPPRREWSLGWNSLYPSESAVIEGFRYRVHGDGPFWFLPQDALATNMLTPEESLLLPGHVSPGATRVNGGVAADGVYVPNAVAVSDGAVAYVGELQGVNRLGVPVTAGDRITVSAYGAGAGRLRVRYADIAGNLVASHVASNLFSGSLERVWFSSTVPTNAVIATLNVVAPTEGTVVFGAPAISLGDKLTDWGTGRGCRRATVASVSGRVKQAIRNTRNNRSEISMTIREVG